MPRQAPVIPDAEQRFRDFIAARGADLDAQALVFNLSHTARDVASSIDSAAVHPVGLTHAGYVMLMTLWIFGPRETRELAVDQRVTRGAIVNAVHTLQRAGLVRRIRSIVDRRLVTVELTTAGKELIESVHNHWHQWEQAVAAALPRNEQQEFVRMLRVVAEHVKTLRKTGLRSVFMPQPSEE
jgi:DNA-binding MarR family transcriptional regulator